MKKRQLVKKGEEPHSMVLKCSCPYCDVELVAAAVPYCRHCKVTLRYCEKCQTAVAKDATACPKCGGQLVWK